MSISEQKVSEETAKLFYELCGGTYSGHMANVPHNPELHKLCSIHEATTTYVTKNFSSFLRKIADRLDEIED